MPTARAIVRLSVYEYGFGTHVGVKGYVKSRLSLVIVYSQQMMTFSILRIMRKLGPWWSWKHTTFLSYFPLSSIAKPTILRIVVRYCTPPSR